ncbi:MAG: hypothetical protein AB8F78_01265 [Saprospiraceae bacterium]
MNKSLLWLVALLFVLLGLFWFLRNQETEVKASAYPDREFAIKDEASIDRVFIADLRGRTMNLTKQSNGLWLINDSVKASVTIMDQVLNTLSKIRIDHIPPETMNKTIFESMKTTGIKIEAYDSENRKLRSLILGPATHDERASFMMVEGQNQPYAMKLPGHTGTLRPLFDLRSVEEWRSRDWIAIKSEDIQSVEVNYPRQTGSGFSIRRVGDTLQLNAESELVAISQKAPSQRLLESYLEGFAYVPLLRRKDDYDKKDSIMAMVPFVELRITQKSGDIEELSMVPAFGRLKDGSLDLEGVFSNYWVIQKPGHLQTVQVQQMKEWLRDYRSFY